MLCKLTKSMSIIVGVMFIFTSTICFADDQTVTNPSPTPTPIPVTSGDKKGIDAWQLNFGLGVEQYKDTYINQASIYGADRRVIVEKDYKTLPSAWLTLNWNLWSLTPNKHKGDVDTIMCGFFAGVKVIDSTSQIFSGFALGPQVSFILNNKAVSIGAGWVTHETKTFAQNISEGSPLPIYYDDVKYREGTENSYILMMSVQLF